MQLNIQSLARYVFVGVVVAAAAVHAGTWSGSTPLTLGVGLTASRIGTTIFAACPFDTSSQQIQKYDDAGVGTWSQVTQTTPACSGSGTDLRAASSGNKYLFKSGTTQTVVVYDSQGNTYTSTTYNGPARQAEGVTTVGDKIFFAGGWDAGSTAYAQVDVYDATAGTWSSGGSLSQARHTMMAASAGTTAVFAGGVNGDYSVTYKTVDIRFGNGTWVVSELRNARSYGAAVGVGSQVLIAGGIGDSTDVDIYDIATNTWSYAALSFGRGGLSAASVGQKAIFAGGQYDTGGVAVNRIDIYDLSVANPAMRWSVHTLISPRLVAGAVTLGTRVFFIGGTDYNGVPVNAVDVYEDNACLSQPLTCQHGGSCVTLGQNSTCQCVPGYTGSLCQTDIDECLANPCPAGATCVDHVNSRICVFQSSTGINAQGSTGSSGNSSNTGAAGSTGSQPLVAASSTGPTNFSSATKSTLTTAMSVLIHACAIILCIIAW